ncbi:MAG: HipA domain-containing protein [Candidatus Kapabacteria bacterium]|nr:HipA domain-containing protein [Candidatus Kapabacteria bacterium]
MTLDTNRCLYCYKEIPNASGDFHAACSRKFFGKPEPPEIEFSELQLQELAERFVRTQEAVGGVQPKLSLSTKKKRSEVHVNERLTVVGLNGNFILKPQNKLYPNLPEVEDLTMHLADVANVPVVPHSLVRLASGELAYITRRIDRVRNGVRHMEDMCQLTERLTEDKYKGSYEQVGKAIMKYSHQPGLDLIRFAELLVFCYLTGNADMHLKNFSLIQLQGNEFVLAPAYDLVNTSILMPSDNEELALPLNGHKSKLHRKHFETGFTTMGLTPKQQEGILNKYRNVQGSWTDMVSASFLSEEYKVAYTSVLSSRYSALYNHHENS